MPFIKKYGVDFIIENNQIKLTSEYLENNRTKFKKITGSRLANVLDLNSMCSSVKTWAMMVGIYTEPMDEMLSKAGNVIEPKIRDYVKNKLNINYCQYNPIDVKFDVFKDNTIFGGIPDGEPIVNDKVCYDNDLAMLEIKTTSIDSFLYKKENNLFVLQRDENNFPIVKQPNGKRNKWFDENQEIIIPLEYRFQLSLYCYLRNINHGIFAICFLKPIDYVYPELCDINDREIQLVDLRIDIDKFKSYIDLATNWYKKYIVNGISPKLNQSDLEWLKLELNI